MGKGERFATLGLSVIASLIASVLFAIFSNPILSFINYLVSSLITPFYQGFVDSLYTQAAVGATDEMLYGLLAIFLSTVITFMLAGSFVIFFISRDIQESTYTSDKPRPGVVSRLIISRHAERVVRYLVIIFACLGVPNALVILARDYTVVQAHSTFDVRLRALAPYLSEAETRALVGSWARMQTRAEYDKINTLLEDSARKFNVMLPRRLI